MLRKAFIVWVIVASLSDIVFAQKKSADSTTIIFSAQGHYGFILAHSKDVIDISQTNPWGFTAELSRIRNTQASWNTCNCVSQNGISFSYFNFNYPDVLGSSISLSLFGEPILWQRNVILSLRGAAGLSYLSHVYSAENNPSNIFFSQPLSGLLQAQLNIRFNLTPTWQVRTGISYNHISNGGMRKPNKGMNFPMLNVGVDYLINPLPYHRRERIASTPSALHYYAGLFMNTRDVVGEENKRKPMVGLQVGFLKPFTLTNAVGIAVEGSYDASLKKANQIANENYDHRILSGLLRHHFLFGRFDFSQALGIYLYHKTPTNQAVFQRYALEYKLNESVKAGFSLKAHLQVAENMDLRITYVF